ncbi:MAG: hydantoinase/oxoprolinase family protein [Woeseiaceae bacterium]
MKTLIGIDTGGTFTDFIVYQKGLLSTHKVLSTPHAPEQAILQGLKDLALNLDEVDIVHGSTVATNALLEGKGVVTAYITNFGLADVLSIGRQTRKELYELQPLKPLPPVAAEYCLETGGRISADAEMIEPLTEAHLEKLREQIKTLNPKAVAINLLFSYLDNEAEKRIADIIPQSIFTSLSSQVLAEYKEYERGMATWLNSYVGPLVQDYLKRLQQALPKTNIAVMQSAGGTISAEFAGQQAVHMLLSGPAGGLAAAKFIGDVTAKKKLLTFDMGGTSTDVAMIDGELLLTNESEIAGYPVAIPMVDMHTIGAGGGSIASIDSGGLLQVGPESAGADPGPACYAKGGQVATVTDANLVLGRLQAEAFLGGSMRLDKTAAVNVITKLATALNLSLEETALGIITLANEHMAQALRVMSVQRGIDPQVLTLVSFGGAGGLHVCALAESLNMQQAMVPRFGGVLSALGMLVAPRARELSQTYHHLFKNIQAEDIEQQFKNLLTQGIAELEKEGVPEEELSAEYSVDCRYLGQSYFLNVKWHQSDSAQAITDFKALHEKRYGHQLEFDVELVNIRLSLKAKMQNIQLPVISSKQNKQKKVYATLAGVEQEVEVLNREACYCGEKITGPALITEKVSTTYIAPGWQCEVDKYGNLLLVKMK